MVLYSDRESQFIIRGFLIPATILHLIMSEIVHSINISVSVCLISAKFKSYCSTTAASDTVTMTGNAKQA
jgi:hypothetical protein